MSGDDLTIVLFLVGTAISIAGTAMSAAGWKHHFFIASLFFVAGVFLVAGVAWPATKNISPTVTAVIEQIATHPVSWFAILILGMGAVTFLPRRPFQKDVAPPRNEQMASPKLPKEWFSPNDAIEQIADKALLEKRKKVDLALERTQKDIDTITNEMKETPFNLDKNMQILKELEDQRDRQRDDYMSYLYGCMGYIQNQLKRGLLIAKGFRRPHIYGNPMVVISQDEWFILDLDFDTGIAKQQGSQDSVLDSGGYIGIVIGEAP